MCVYISIIFASPLYMYVMCLTSLSDSFDERAANTHCSKSKSNTLLIALYGALNPQRMQCKLYNIYQMQCRLYLPDSAQTVSTPLDMRWENRTHSIVGEGRYQHMI